MEGNQQMMREALTLIVGYEEVIYACVQSGHGSGVDWEGIVFAMIDKAKEALSAPPRQCDVGTAEEQVVRFRDAMVHECLADEYCRCKDAARCFAQWAQAPHAEEGGAA